jgi:hypothetical protein
MTGGRDPYEHWEPHDGDAALRNQITQTRADLGETITELAARVDVKARARQAVAQARSRAREAVWEKTRAAALRTKVAARSGASSARRLLDRTAQSRVSLAIGGGAAALAGLGVYALTRRRTTFRAGAFAPGRGRRAGWLAFGSPKRGWRR